MVQPRAYRVYSRFTHAAYTAVAGSLDTNSLDSPIMATCACCGLEAVTFAGGNAPNLIALRTRLSRLDDNGKHATDLDV